MEKNGPRFIQLLISLITADRCGLTEFNCDPKPTKEPQGGECKHCATTGYTYEHRVFMGDTLRKLEDKTWEECAEECDKNTACFAFSYQTEAKRCYLKRGSNGIAVYKEGFVHSRNCGTSPFSCPGRF